MGVIPMHEAIVKNVSKHVPASLPSNANGLIPCQSASPPINTMTNSRTNFLTSTANRSQLCEGQPGQAFTSHLMHSTSNISELGTSTTVLQSGSSTTVLSKPTASNTAGTLSKNVIRRNCSYASVSKSFPYYIPVPSSAKLKGKPKKYQSFIQTATEQEQSVLSPSGSEGSSRDSGFNSDSSSPIPPVVPNDIDQLLDELASLDDIM